MVSPGDFQRRSALARKLSAAGARFGSSDGGAVVLDFGAPEVERDAARSLGLADLSALARVGFKGPGTCRWLTDQGASLPSQPNQAVHQTGGELIARLAEEEALILSPLDRDQPGLVDQLLRAWSAEGQPSPRGYPVPRQDSHAWLMVTGGHAADVFAKLCAVDLRPRHFADLSVAQSSVARLSAIVVRADLGDTLSYALLTDSASANYLWDCLIDAMAEFDGRPVGLTALREL